MTARPSLLDLRRLAAMSAAASLALAQPVFTLILENPEEFPTGGLFHVWVLFWTLLLPSLALMAVDTLLERRGTRVFPAWRAALCAGVALSILRQAFIYNWRAIDHWGMSNLFLLGAIPAAALVAAAAYKHPAGTRRYLSALGVLTILLAGKYAAGAGLWGPAWTSAGMDRAAAPPAPSETPVFLVVFDELSLDVLVRDGRIDAAKYPHFAAFAAENAWFARATTNHMYTAESVPSMLTGRRAPAPASPTLFHYLQGNYVPTLVGGWPFLTRWMRRGAKDAVRFETRGTAEDAARHPWEAGRLLASCAWNALFMRAPARDGSDDPAMLPETSGTSNWDQVDLISSLVAGRSGPGLFVWWHCRLPHSPFVHGADGKLHGRPDTSFAAGLDPQKVYENYLEQTRWTDTLFGHFLAALRRLRIYDRAIIAVTSDHGLRAPGKLQPSGYPAVMNGLVPNIPFLLKSPRVPPGRHEEDYQHVDLVPTLLDLLGVPIPPEAFDGSSVLGPRPPDRPKVFSRRGVDYAFDVPSGLWRARAK
jgi:hypothetical protein